MRVQTVLDGVAGGPAYSTLHFAGETLEAATNARNWVAAFWNTAKGGVRAGVTITVGQVVQVYDSETGLLTDALQPVANLQYSGAGGADQSPAVQAQVAYGTSTFTNGKRLQGRIFIPYLNTDATGAGGVLSTAYATSLAGAANALITASGGSFIVWRKPWAGSLTRPAYAGSTGQVTSAAPRSKLAILRSRRD